MLDKIVFNQSLMGMANSGGSDLNTMFDGSLFEGKNLMFEFDCKQIYMFIAIVYIIS